MSMPGALEAACLAECHKLFENWRRHGAGSLRIHSQAPDLKSFQAGYLQAVIDLEYAKRFKKEGASWDAPALEEVRDE